MREFPYDPPTVDPQKWDVTKYSKWLRPVIRHIFNEAQDRQFDKVDSIPASNEMDEREIKIYNDGTNTTLYTKFNGTIYAFKDATHAEGQYVPYSGANDDIDFGTKSLSLTGGLSCGTVTIANAKDIVFSASTGTKIGTAATQKMAFYGSTPVTQPTAVADTTDATDVATQFNKLLSRLRDLGIIAT